ncbi:hypothetical protein G6F37_008719 [Rhizopus arrhizus]|nr:hypothetical protein G6F38_010265 [Rhizopus arrhizus]KAG1155242.1 hypothetical protein G6F37_008719 [Rhizopus arrhizus]
MEKEDDSFSMVHNPTEVIKLLYSKSKVYIHPSHQQHDFIPGYLTMIDKTSHDYYVAWTPESLMPNKESFVQVDYNPENNQEITGNTSNQQRSPVIDIWSASTMINCLEDGSLYAFSSSLDTIHSLLIIPPNFSTWYGQLIINHKNGQTTGPLWFHDDESTSTIYQKRTQGGSERVKWGGDEFIERLSQLVPVKRSNREDGLYYVNPEKEMVEEESLFESAQMDPVMATLKEARWTLFEKLAQVTKFSREAAANLFHKPAAITENEAVRLTTDDYDSARLFLAKWAAGLADASEKNVPSEQKYRQVGLWGHGLEEETGLGVFEIVNSQRDLLTHTRTEPVSEIEWSNWFDPQGQLKMSEDMIRKRIFCGGVNESIRKEVWLFLTAVYPWHSTALERQSIVEDKRQVNGGFDAQWLMIEQERKHGRIQRSKAQDRTDRTIDLYVDETMTNPDPLFLHGGTNKHLERLKDVLCTYNVYNNTLGYVQGMSDLLSPLYAITKQEHLSFWSFVHFMERMKFNFYKDQSGMHHQLLIMDHLLRFMDPSLYRHLQATESCNFFFCFRWLLVWYKREFPWDDMLTLWEVLWTDYLTDKFHLFIALAILDKHRDHIIQYLMNFDEVLKYMNDLSMTIDLQDILQRAEILFYQFKQRVDAIDSKREQINLTNKSDFDQSLYVHPILRELLSSQ